MLYETLYEELHERMMKKIRIYELKFKLIGFVQDAGLELVSLVYRCSEWPLLSKGEKSYALFYYGRRSI